MESGSSMPLAGFVILLLLLWLNGIFYGFSAAVHNLSENEVEKSDWLVDPTSDFANVEARLFVESAMEMLSPLEQEIFSSCLLGEMPIRQFAERNGMRKSTAWDMANSIRKKLQEIF